MRLRALRLDQFRKFDRPMRLDGLDGGVNVLCAPNEFGKSTLLAAIRAVLFEQHDSKAKPIRGYQTRLGNSAPTISLSFEHAGVSSRIEKRFLHRPHALFETDGVRFEANAAEERLATMLGVSAAGRGSRDAARQTASIWGALLVDQGESFAQAELGDNARATLADCLQAELGTVSGGVAINRLLKPVLAGLAEKLDGHGKPRDRHKQALADEVAATGEIAALEGRRRVLLDDLAALDTARAALAGLSDPAGDAQARAALESARRERETLLFSRDRVARATASVTLAERDAEAARSALQRRTALAASVDAGGRSLLRLRETADAASGRLDAAEAALKRGRTAAADAATRVDEAARALRECRARHEAAERAHRHAALRDRLDEATRQNERIVAIGAALTTLKPDAAGMTRLRDAAAEDRADRAALLAQSTQLSIALSVPAELHQPGARPSMLPPGEQLLELAGPARLVIGDVGAISIRPAAGERAGLIDRAAKSARHLRTLLEEAGCTDLAEAERRSAARAEHEAALTEARRVLAATVGPGGLESLRTEELALRPPEDADSGTEAPDTAALVAAERAAEAAQDAERAAREALVVPEAARDALRTALNQADLALRTAEAEQMRLVAAFEQACAAGTEETLAARVAETEQALADGRGALQALIAAAPEGTIPLADSRIARLEQAARNRTDAQAAERERIARLEARIAAEEGGGLDEQIEAASRRRDDAARTVAEDRREIDVLSLLRDTLREADRTARERHLAPLVGRIAPYLRALFPGGGVALDERFLVAGLHREAAGTGEPEPFEQLSHGTREQISILARLAFADMLQAAGHPSFLVLDDALAFADPARLERMFDILHEAGQRLQILVLTCRPDLAVRLGGRTVMLEPTEFGS